MNDSAPHYIVATGDVGPAGGGVVINVVFTAGSDAATLTLRKGGSGGSIFAVVKAAANVTAVASGLYWNYDGQLHATLAGTGPVATIGL